MKDSIDLKDYLPLKTESDRIHCDLSAGVLTLVRIICIIALVCLISRLIFEIGLVLDDQTEASSVTGHEYCSIENRYRLEKKGYTDCSRAEGIEGQNVLWSAVMNLLYRISTMFVVKIRDFTFRAEMIVLSLSLCYPMIGWIRRMM
jgi:hypothetical protein